MTPRNIITGETVPLVYFNDWPSAYSYALAIFKKQFGVKTDARDLIYYIKEGPATGTGTTTGTTSAPTGTDATTTVKI
jgi:hypothetical protein